MSTSTRTLWACLAVLLTAAPINAETGGVRYEKVSVKAPFPMPPIKVPVFPQRDFVITEFGAKPGGEFDNTEAIRKTIEACHKAGGGRVRIPEGVWLTGAVHLKSNVNLHLDKGAVLSFSDDPKGNRYENAKNVKETNVRIGTFIEEPDKEDKNK